MLLFKPLHGNRHEKYTERSSDDINRKTNFKIPDFREEFCFESIHCHGSNGYPEPESFLLCCLYISRAGVAATKEYNFRVLRWVFKEATRNQFCRMSESRFLNGTRFGFR
ncbi:hypothetical protein JTE90_022811 [Oedothorax gibbosus]|uniref:Uncharacterized protein n=1 Tax=Oedothorax gibbosus TaxID=931172 RepID=A0AAV6V563_9ARAC|nr:hypothetical protein JTE90_022811 [Oedothorax gibbosus]